MGSDKPEREKEKERKKESKKERKKEKKKEREKEREKRLIDWQWMIHAQIFEPVVFYQIINSIHWT
jgi:hypothetical protein